MTDLTDARELAETFLNTIDDVRAVAVIPKTFTPPIVWIAAGSPFRQKAQTKGKKRINLVAVCLGGMSTNDAAEGASEDLAEAVANALDHSLDFRLDPIAEIDQPRLYPAAQGQQMIGIAVNFFTEADRA